jgi:phage terminase small subunit
LTEKQQRFVEEYLIDLNATQAAIRAGYSAKTAYSSGQRMLKNVEVARLIEDGMKARSIRTELTQDWVLERLKENVERAMQAEEIVDSKGVRTGEYRYDGGVANGALQLIGRHLAMFTDKQEVAHTGSSGVLIVKATTDVTGWSKEAVDQQQQLQQHPPSIPVEH